AAIIGEKLPKFVIAGDAVWAAHSLCAQAEPSTCLVSNAVRTSATKSLESVYVFSSKGCIQAGERKFIAHYLERHAQQSSAQLAARENDGRYRVSITPQEMEMWEKQGELAAQTGQVQGVKDSRTFAPRLISQSWRYIRMLSNRSNDSGF
ncbi:hypothetical protein PMAYCL1PPCAC_14983, partial [Pristionchus mayeri]